MSALELLNRFVEWDDECGRSTLLRPWIDGGHAYATNGHWCVRLSIEALAPDEREALPQRTPEHVDIAAIYAKHANAWAWADASDPLPAIDAPPTCDSCEGKGRRPMLKCPACDEWGVFFHFGDEYDCKNCDGDVYVPAGAEQVGAEIGRASCRERV